MRKFLPATVILGALALSTMPAHASDPWGATRVPVSAFARPAAWLDPSRMQITSSFSFGTGFGGGPSQGLQVTSLQYRIGEPLAVRVSMGNAFGVPGARGSSPFLEGLDLSYRPFDSFMVQV